MSDTTRAYNKLVSLLTGITGLVKATLVNTISISQTKVTLTANTSASLVTANPTRRYLAIMNIGDAAAALGIDGAAVLTDGWSLAAGGGGLVWEGTGVPSNAISAISAASTTIIVLEG